jgi:protein disulfide-isomerase
MRQIKVLFFLAANLSLIASEPISLIGWQNDYPKAQTVAMQKQKPLLVAFLGPNWCGSSDQFENEILASPDFLEGIKGEMLLVKVDLPEKFQEENYQGKGLKERYEISECPSLILLDSNGIEIAKLPSLPLTGEEYALYVKQIYSDYQKISHLETQEIKHLKVDELQHLYVRAGRLADTTFKSALLQQGLKVDRGPYFLLEQYQKLLTSDRASPGRLKKLRGKILARDPENALGCRRRLALLDFEALTRTPHAKSEKVIQPVVDYLEEFGNKDIENTWRLEMRISQYLFSQNQLEGALQHAQASYKAAPNEQQKEIADSIDYLQTCLKK